MTSIPTSTVHSSLQPWRDDITGLRALAVLPVLLYHAFPQVLPGGFFGVDIFFVISGYLISGIIFRGLVTGTFSYTTFYAKRIKRIIPNLLLVLLFVMVAGYFCLPSTDYARLGGHIQYSAGFMQNFRLLHDVGYFTEDALRTPLLHLWSLAIEEQFYIVFPILAWGMWRWRASPKALGVFCLFIVVASFIACLARHSLNGRFYSPQTRFFEIGFGVLLAWWERFGRQVFTEGSRLRRLIDVLSTPSRRSALSVLAVMTIVVCFAVVQQRMGHPGLVTLLPVLSATLLIGVGPTALVNRTLLAFKPMIWVGLISYSLYLWHWPLLAFANITIPAIDAQIKWTTLLLSFVIASIVYCWVENPIRHRPTLLGLNTVVALLIALVIVAGLGYSIKKVWHGLPNRTFAPVSAIERVRNTSEWAPFQNAFLPVGDESTNFRSTNPEQFPDILFLGDSHTAQYGWRIADLDKRYQVTAGIGAVGNCPLFDSEQTTWPGTQQCQQLSEAVYPLLFDRRLKVLVLGSFWATYIERPSHEQAMQKLKSELMSQRPNLKVYVLLDYPWSEGPLREGGDGHQHEQGLTDPMKYWSFFDFRPERFVVPDNIQPDWNRGNTLAHQYFDGWATFIPTAEKVCPNHTCDLLHWYKDDDHLQPRTLQQEATWLDQTFAVFANRQETPQ